MSQVDSGQYTGMSPPAPPTPPTEPPYMAFDEPKGWPKVVGIISIVWASLGLICNGCGLFSPQIAKAFLTEEMKKAPLPPSMTVSIEMYALIGAGVVVTIILFAAGIALVSRKRSGRVLHLVWGVLAIIMAVIALFMQWRMHLAMNDWAAQNPDSMFAKQHLQGGKIGLMIGLTLGVVLGFAWPVFCLVWFGLIKRNPAEIDAGIEQSVV